MKTGVTAHSYTFPQASLAMKYQRMYSLDLLSLIWYSLLQTGSPHAQILSSPYDA